MRKTKVITLTFDVAQMRFDDRLWEDFQKNCNVESIQSHLLQVAGSPCLTFIVTYFEKELSVSPVQSKHPIQSSEHWRTLLDASQMGIFEILRGWRSKCARDEGVPPYVLLTNMQLALIVRKRPTNLSDLLEMPSIGEAKVKKYGEKILKILTGVGVLGAGGGNDQNSDLQ